MKINYLYTLLPDRDKETFMVDHANMQRDHGWLPLFRWVVGGGTILLLSFMFTVKENEWKPLLMAIIFLILGLVSIRKVKCDMRRAQARMNALTDAVAADLDQPFVVSTSDLRNDPVHKDVLDEFDGYFGDLIPIKNVNTIRLYWDKRQPNSYYLELDWVCFEFGTYGSNGRILYCPGSKPEFACWNGNDELLTKRSCTPEQAKCLKHLTDYVQENSRVLQP